MTTMIASNVKAGMEVVEADGYLWKVLSATPIGKMIEFTLYNGFSMTTPPTITMKIRASSRVRVMEVI